MHTHRGRYCVYPYMKYISDVLKTWNSYENHGPLPVSTNHAIITCTKQKHQNKFGTVKHEKHGSIQSENLKDMKQQDSNEGVT